MHPLDRRPARPARRARRRPPRSAVGVRRERRRPPRPRGRAARACRRRARPAPRRPACAVGSAAARACVHLGGGHAEPVRLAGEVAADLVGVQVGLGVAGRARWSVAELPAVGAVAQERLQHRQAAASPAWPLAGPAQRPSSQPSSGAMCGLPAAASAACTSMSGLRPGETWRNTLRITVSPKTTEVLLCSAPMTIDGPPAGSSSTLGSRWNAEAVAGRRSVADAVEPQRRDLLVVQRVVGPGARRRSPHRRRVREVLDRLAGSAPAAPGRSRCRRRRRTTVTSASCTAGSSSAQPADGGRVGDDARSGPCRRTSAAGPGTARAGRQRGRVRASSRRRSRQSLRRGQPEPVEAVPGDVSR